MPGIATIGFDQTVLEQGIRQRRLWYHNIEVTPGVCTRFAEDYDAYPALRSVDAGNDALEELLRQHLPGDLSGATVLDLGCADGRFTIWAARRHAARVAGVERNHTCLQRARFLTGAMGLDNIELFGGSIERNRPTDRFDYVFCLGLIYHLIDPLGTLHALCKQCNGKLALTSAIDLPHGNGEPLSRLDRYATGAHGLWSFNVPMLRQLLTTAGFEIEVEELTPDSENATHFAAIASPSAASDHQIFEDEIDQEFPVNLAKRRDVVVRSWQALSGKGCGVVAIFGGGTHTPWLLDQIAGKADVKIACILDDRIPHSREIAGIPVCRPTEIDPDAIDAIVISSWHQQRAIRHRAEELFAERVPIIDLVE